MINVAGLTFYYTDTSDPALKDITLTIGDGEFVLLTGPSGGGKSSFCRCLNGLIPHFYGGSISGQVIVAGQDTLKSSTKEMATSVGFVFQDPENQLVSLDVEREIAFGLENLGFPRDLIAKRLEESLDTLGIAHLRYRPLNELSGGEKQKVAIAAVLALHPKVLVLDEPTSELDPKGAEDLLSVITRLNDELGLTVLLVEHRLDRVIQYVDRLIIFNDGAIVIDGAIDDIMTNRYRELTEIGIGVPPLIRLFQELRKRDTGISKIPLTVKEGRSTIRETFQNLAGSADRSEDRETATGDKIVSIKNLWYAYPDGPTVLKSVNLEMHRGELVAIMGRNASGKTTLVKHFNRLLVPTKGQVKIAGVDTRKASVAQLARQVGFVFQNPNDHLFADTVRDEIAFTMKNLGFDGEEARLRLDQALERFHLSEYRDRYPRSLSGGEKQRVALASVLAPKPQILILDEPTRGMEYRLKSELMSFLQEYCAQGNTVVLVTHDVEIAAEYAARVILMSEGRVIVDGEKHDVLSQALLFSPQINRLAQSYGGHDMASKILTVSEALDRLP